MRRKLRAFSAAMVMGMSLISTSACISLPNLTGPRMQIPDGIPPGGGVQQPFVNINGPGRTASKFAAWAKPIARSTGIPLLALEAYGNAAETLRQTRPECGLKWTTLAGLAAVESKNGTYHGAQIHPNGDVTPPIRGVPLDGTSGNLDLPDTDHGKFDGDAAHDRAMGPFQIIPETWQRFGVDANGDGVASPDNIDDAALTAGRYLCVKGGDLSTAKGWEKAILSYNNSRGYMLAVRDKANAYSVGES